MQLDIYINFYTQSEFFGESARTKAKQYKEKPAWSVPLTYSQMTHNELPQWNYTVPTETLKKIQD